jgi:protein-disulfide isomerase
MLKTLFVGMMLAVAAPPAAEQLFGQPELLEPEKAFRISARALDDNPIDKLVVLGKRLGANSTPTWFVQSGERYSGAMPLDEVRHILDRASPKR